MEIAQLLLHNVLSFIVIISVIVFVHEFGHYWVAKKSGVKIDSFSIGFGPEIFGWNDKSGTRWKLSLVPMGGYVKMFGDDSAASTPDAAKVKKMTAAERKVAFHTQSLPIKFAIVSAGPVANFILAIVIFTFFFSHYGKPVALPQVGEVKAESAAAQAGLQKGDMILTLDGSAVHDFSDIRNLVALSPNIPIAVEYERAGEKRTTTLTPALVESVDVFGNKARMGVIGVTSGEMRHEELAPGQAFVTSITETYGICARTLKALGQMITGTRPADELSGILRIGDYSGDAVKQGMQMVLWFMAVLSINLGLVNLFPVPMLDGGHLFFYMVEAVRGKPLPERMQEVFFRFGFALLMALMVFATFNDLKYFGVFGR